MVRAKTTTTKPKKTRAVSPHKKTCVWKLYQGDKIRVMEGGTEKIFTVGIPDTTFFGLATSIDGDVIRPAYGTPIRYVDGAYELIDILAEARIKYGALTDK
jgi:hypothetical protein